MVPTPAPAHWVEMEIMTTSNVFLLKKQQNQESAGGDDKHSYKKYNSQLAVMIVLLSVLASM